MTKARVDLLSAKVLFDAGLTDPACFHSQQSAEKYLKALLEEHDRVIPRTHDLLVLIDMVTPYIAVRETIRDAAAMLTVHAIEVRYPGTDRGVEDAKDAISSAGLIQRWALSFIGEGDMDEGGTNEDGQGN